MKHISFLKKILLISAIIIFFCIPDFTHAATKFSLAPNNLGLVGYWSFNEGNGTIAHDFSGNGNTGTLTNGPAWTSGKLDQALNFNGSNSYVTGSGSSLPNTGSAANITLSAWIYPTSTSSAKAIFTKGQSGSCFNYGLDINNGVLQARTSSSNISLGGNIQTNVWQHVVVVYNSSGTITGYVNGVSVGASSAVTSSCGDTNWSIGVRAYNANTSEGFSGKIDELRIYTRALSASDVSSLYNAGLAKLNTSTNSLLTNGLVDLWSFDGADVSGTTAFDRSGQANNGTLTNSPKPTLGKVGQGLSFNGSNTYIQIPGAAFGTYPSSSGTFSFGIWFKTTTGGVILGNDDGTLPNGAAGGYVPALYIDTSGNVRASLFWHNASSYQIVSGNTYTDGKWHQAIDTYNNGTETLYIDGVSVGSQSVTEAGYSGSYGYFLGTGYTPGWTNVNGGWYYFNGILDDMRIYNRTLSSAEIKQLYNAEGGAHVNTSQNNTLTSGLVGDWSFDGPDISGTTAYDRSGQGNNGTLISNPTPVIGKMGQALNFNGSTQYVNAGNNSSEQLTTGTISAWIKTSNAGSSFRGIFAKQSAYGMFLDSNVFVLYDWGGSAERSSGISLNDNTWHNTVCTFQSGVTNGTICYVDGVSVMTTTMSVSNQAVALEIGEANASQNFGGTIDDARLYNRVLSPSEVKQLYNIGK